MAEAAEEEVSLRFHVTLNVISSSNQQLHFNFNNLIFTVNNKMPKKIGCVFWSSKREKMLIIHDNLAFHLLIRLTATKIEFQMNT